MSFLDMNITKKRAVIAPIAVWSITGNVKWTEFVLTMRTPQRLLLNTLALMITAVGVCRAEAPIDFNRDIRPILSENCYFCHGPDEHDRKADLRLDDRQAAIDQGSLVPGDIDSEVIYRLLTDDEDELMPPPKSNKKLTKDQIELLTRWVKEGAEYQEHWSLVSPAKAVVNIAEANPVDRFIKKRLHGAGLDFSPQADLRTLIRRVTFDLTGLPPKPEQVQAFLADAEKRGADVAYEALVDRLFASHAYGERMTLAWLDAARYGDSSVMHADGPRDMWPWRDWVIDSYNNNKPFDQFTIEQLAGDLIPNATVDQKIASGFNRNHATSDEGGAFAEELRVEYVVDRVSTTSTVWMGLTMECAQCHDHKYDPISMKEYYQFYAYFNNTADPGMQTRKGNQTPVVEVPDPARDAKLADMQVKIDQHQAVMTKHREKHEEGFVKWAVAESAKVAEQGGAKEPDGLAHWFPLNETEGKELKNDITGAVATLTKGKFQSGADRDGVKTLKINGAEFTCSSNPPTLHHDQPFSFAAWLRDDGSSGAVFARMDTANGFRGYDMWVQGGGVGTHIIHSWSGDAIKVVSEDKLKKDTWQHVVVTYDGSMKAAGVKIYIDGKLSKGKVEADSLKSTIETNVPFKIGARSNGSGWKGQVDDLRIYSRDLTAEEVPHASGDAIGGILATTADQRSDQQVETLRAYYFANNDDAYKKLNEQAGKLSKQYSDLDAKPTTSMIMTDNPANKMRMTYILDRGAYDSPKEDEQIHPGVPAALPAMAENAPQNRLGLAQWLTQPDHPLTARVAINRYWMMLFGDGLVRTAGDFGAQGIPPTHPQLLDWLAVDFADSGWDVKRMLKQLVMSRTYRQSSRHEEIHYQRDPENLLLARSPRFRLVGEFIRDQALAVSGLMVDQVGGPAVKPYQPANIWNEVSLNRGLRYQQDKGEKLYRRSMYTYWKRSAPMPNMLIFDVPTREKCVVQRPRTNTPLQALVTLNDPQFVEASRHLAERLIKAETDEAKRIDLAYQLCTSRTANDAEKGIISGLLAEQRDRFAKDTAAAAEFLKVGESPRDESIDQTEHASWTVIAQMILNLDETLTRN